MADEKKPEAKPSSETKPDPFVEIVWLFATLFIVLFLINGVVSRISNSKILSSGLSGFTDRGVLISNSKPIGEVESPMLGPVVSVNDTDVYDSPNGKKIGNQKIGSRGKITQGPVMINGVKYWYVDYETGQDGWVAEDDIRYVVSEPSIFDRFVSGTYTMVWYLKLFIVILSIIGIIIITYLIIELTKLRVAERKRLYPEVFGTLSSTNPRWDRILNQLESVHENDWRLAILEADIILGELLDSLFLPGETMGDKLKAVTKGDFINIDKAWEAHKMRNIIAHEGEAFLLNQREARRVIGLYKSVFEEFKII